jgi:cytochrome o ubiquinol oxidase subunit 1
MAGIACQAIQLVVSVRDRRQLRDTTGNPWAGRTLEWFTPSPPPAWNFTVLPSVGRFARHTRAQGTPDYKAIEVPNNSPIGFITAFCAVVTGFALIWHIWWMAGLGLLGAFVTLLAFAFRRQEEVEVSAVEIARFDRAHPAEVMP